MKAILSQFAKKLDDELRSVRAPASRKKHPAAKGWAQRQSMAHSGSTHGPGKSVASAVDSDFDDSSDGDSDNDMSDDSDNGTDPLDGLDQDEDVILWAEAAQQEDIDQAIQSAELEVRVTDSEQTVASMALAKVSLTFIVPRIYADCTQ